MATGAAGVPDSIQAAAGFVPNRTPAQGSRLLVTLSCYIDPYPMVKTADGGLSIVWLDRAWAVAFITPVISMILALFGKGLPRILLLVSGVLCLVLAYGSMLQNGV